MLPVAGNSVKCWNWLLDLLYTMLLPNLLPVVSPLVTGLRKQQINQLLPLLQPDWQLPPVNQCRDCSTVATVLIVTAASCCLAAPARRLLPGGCCPAAAAWWLLPGRAMLPHNVVT
jgi:hypothetical protein